MKIFNIALLGVVGGCIQRSATALPNLAEDSTVVYQEDASDGRLGRAARDFGAKIVSDGKALPDFKAKVVLDSKSDETLSESAGANLPSFLMGTDSGANQIVICAKEMNKITPRPSRNAIVHCYDKDPNGDDLMAEEKTGSDGCARLTYKNQSWDGLLGGRSPDIYCTVNKPGFMEATPPDLDHHDQNTLAKMKDVMLYRDRSADYGHDNGCGAAGFTDTIGANDLAALVLRFKDQCTMHDKCYWDCQIFLWKGNKAEAQAFCDSEMRAGMRSYCHKMKGHLPGFGEDLCLARAESIYQLLQSVGDKAYDKNDGVCPDKDDESMGNKYEDVDLDCYPDGNQCGYNGSSHDDLEKCNLCCNGEEVKDNGIVWDDHYCKCFPKENLCGTTLVGKSFNRCDQCCKPGKKIDDGWTYDDYYCL